MYDVAAAIVVIAASVMTGMMIERWRTARQLTGAVAGGDLGRTDILDRVQAHRGEHFQQRRRFVPAPDGLANTCNAGREPLDCGGTRVARHAHRRIGVIEDHAGAAGLPGDPAQGGKHGRLAEVGNDAEPGEERGSLRVETRGAQADVQGFTLEVHGRERQRRGNRNGSRIELRALPRLRCGMVDFEDPHAVRNGGSVGVGVETCPEYHHLAGALRDRRRDGILGKASPRGDEKTQTPQYRLCGCPADRRARFVPQYLQSQRIGKNCAVFEDLVGGPVGCGAERRTAWSCSLHFGMLNRAVHRHRRHRRRAAAPSRPQRLTPTRMQPPRS